MQSKAKTVVVLGTGGTIAGVAATPADHVGYRAAQLGVAALVAAVPASAGLVIETEQVAQLDSKDMDFATWRALAQRTAHHAARAEVAGIVVTHGTDTLEETAYFLGRLLMLAKPVVLVAAMRPATSSEADGQGNLGDAILLAAQADWCGVVVVLAGEVHAARDVRKVHPHRLDAYSSGDAGPLGHIVDGKVVRQRRAAADGDPVGIEVLPDDTSVWPWVEIVTSAAGSDGRAAELLLQAGVDGIVVAGTGNGTVHERLAAVLATAARRGVAVLRSTRCLGGSVVAIGADELPSAADLTPVKARIELILRLLAERHRARQGAGPARSAPRSENRPLPASLTAKDCP
jgi:L-asparaginase